MFKKKLVINYESLYEYYPNPIGSSKNYVPDWYKNISKWKNNEMFDIATKKFNPTLKHCVPFLEAMISGYMITLPYDLYVKNDSESSYLSWNSIEYPPGVRDNVADPALVPIGHYPIEYLWTYPLSHTIPKGYSLLFTHPLNRHDLPFTTLSGIVDGDFIMYAGGQVPFYIKKDFEGVIPKGTPIVQIILFRSENWKSKKTKGLLKLGELQKKQATSVFFNFYKNAYWKRKKYD